MLFHTTPDNSVLDDKGRIIFFSLPRFIADISQGSDCFVCGVKPDTVPFNDEHILPDWILRRYSLHDKRIYLPNGTYIRYGEYKIPCCEECNRRMGDEFEKPISECFSRGSEAVSQELKDNGPWRLFSWMSLIFLKTHLKDKYLALDRDRRKAEMRIGELHDWTDLHHLHCVARSFYSGCDLAREVMGSLLVLPAKVRGHFESFDYCDISAGQTLLLRVDDTAIITVFDDSQAALSVYYDELDKIGGPLSPLQVREIAIRLASINIHLAERPRFSSEFDLRSGEYKILCHRPSEVRLADWQDERQGLSMHQLCKDMVSGPDRAQILENLKTGRYTFLVNEEGKFQHDHMELAPLPIADDQGN
jgi:hypothetical protein